MNTLAITPHEPQEVLLDSVDEVFQEAQASQAYWEGWQKRKQMKSLQIEVPEAAYWALVAVAKQQGKTAAELVQALMNGILTTLLPSAQLSLREASGKHS